MSETGEVETPRTDTPPWSTINPDWEHADPVGWLLDVIDHADQQAITRSENVSVAILAQRIINKTTAILVESVAQIRRKEPRTVELEVSMGLTLTEHGVTRLLDHADAMADLPRLAALVRAGDLDVYRLECVHDVVRNASPEVQRQVEDAVLPVATEKTSSTLRRRARRALLKADPEGAQQRHERAKKGRSVQLYPQDDAMSEIRAFLPAPQAQQIYDTLSRDARCMTRAESDGRTMDQRRADAFIDRLLGTNTTPVAEVRVIISADTLRGLDNEPVLVGGYGPVHAELGRMLAANGRWRIFRTDEKGNLDAVSADRYRPSDLLAEFIRTRDLTCTMPTCAMPSESCDLDHVTPFPHGDTVAANLQPVSRHHHKAKHEYGYTVTRNRDGTTTWTTPTGRTYINTPEPLPGTEKPPPEQQI